MSHTTAPAKGADIKSQICNGQISRNAQVAGFSGPNDTLASLVSTGQIDLSKMAGSLSFKGFGGE